MSGVSDQTLLVLFAVVLAAWAAFYGVSRLHPDVLRGLATAFVTAMSLALACLGVLGLLAGRKAWHDFESWKTAKPVDIAVDLSRPGEFTAPFIQTCSISHGESLCLMVPPGRSISVALSQVRFQCSILDANGREIESLGQKDRVDGSARARGALPLVTFRPFARGKYTLTFRVLQGAPDLEGAELRLFARYDLCGCEALPAAAATFGGIVGCVFSAILGLVAVLLYRSQRRRRRASQEGDSGAGLPPPAPPGAASP